MRKRIFGLMAAVCMLGLFSACSDDDPKPAPVPEPTPTPVVPGDDLVDKEYPASEVEVTISGETITGKIAKFIPKEDGTAELTLEGEPVSMNSLFDEAESKADEETIPTPGVIPGSPTITLPITLEGDATKCTFKGTAETEYCTFSYSGSVDASSLGLEITNLELKDKSFAGTYEFVKNVHDPYISPDAGPDYVPTSNFSLAWESTLRIDCISSVTLYTMGTNYGPSTIGWLLSDILEGYYYSVDGDTNPNASPLDMFSRKFKSVTLTESGDFIINTFDSETPYAKLQYVAEDANTIHLFIEPKLLTNEFLPCTEENRNGVREFLKPLLTAFISAGKEGYPVKYGPALEFTGKCGAPWPNNYPLFNESSDPNHVSFYFDTEFLKPVLESVCPLINTNIESKGVEAYLEDLQTRLGKFNNTSLYNWQVGYRLPYAIISFPKAIENASKLELGFNFMKE